MKGLKGKKIRELILGEETIKIEEGKACSAKFLNLWLVTFGRSEK